MRAYLFILAISAVAVIGCSTPVDNTEALNTLGTKVDTLSGVVDGNSKSQQELESKIETLTKTIEELKDSMAPTPEPKAPDVKEVFADVFENATKVDVIDTAGFDECRAYSEHEISSGDWVDLEVLFVRKEDQHTKKLSWEPDLTIEGVQSNSSTIRIVDNPWNGISDNYESILYKWKFTSKERIGDGNSMTSGTYWVDLATKLGNINSSECAAFLGDAPIHSSNLIEGTVLVAWYVN